MKIDGALLSMDLILMKILKIDLNFFNFFKKRKLRFRKQNLSFHKSKLFEKYFKQRLNSFPIQYIIGKWWFKDFFIKIEPNVLIPRPETEQFVDIVSKQISNLFNFRKNSQTDLNFLEIGTGSGVIFISILKVNRFIFKMFRHSKILNVKELI